ncbi:dienelactone hydrolase family protein [Adhaeribacter aquaticus]|uniref:dienelactone hydrolase family protein n=1 Tax=Adhaeribacter aquaticus TaxID=299567 RepID=UPI00047BB18E|nr:dienelactone hydrolase family protein [Adhaeribacter aquaticus]
MKKLLLISSFFFLSLNLFSQGKEIWYSQGNIKLKGYLAQPKNTPGKMPGIVVLHAWMGITDFEKKSADDLASLGYYALAADSYGENIRPKDAAEAGKLAGQYKNDRQTYRSRIKAAIDQLIKAGADPDRIAVIGYCFGGTGALEAARANFPVKGVISFHGGLDKAANLETLQIKPKVLVLHGADDPFVPKEQVDAFQQEMRNSHAIWEMVYYADAVHAFTEPQAGNDKSKGAAYNELAAKRSWEHMKMFFQEIFGA